MNLLPKAVPELTVPHHSDSCDRYAVKISEEPNNPLKMYSVHFQPLPLDAKKCHVKVRDVSDDVTFDCPSVD